MIEPEQDEEDVGLAGLIDRYTYRGEFALSSGGASDRYVDLRAVALNFPGTVYAHLSRRLRDHPFHPVVVTGVGGALLGMLLRVNEPWRGVYLWNPKGHGVPWSPLPEIGQAVIVVDDVTTGRSLAEMSEAAARAGMIVVDAIGLIDRRDM